MAIPMDMMTEDMTSSGHDARLFKKGILFVRIT